MVTRRPCPGPPATGSEWSHWRAPSFFHPPGCLPRHRKRALGNGPFPQTATGDYAVVAATEIGPRGPPNVVGPLAIMLLAPSLLRPSRGLANCSRGLCARIPTALLVRLRSCGAINRKGAPVTEKKGRSLRRKGSAAGGPGLIRYTSRSRGRSHGAASAYPLCRKGIRDADDQNRGRLFRGASRLSTRLGPNTSPPWPSLQPGPGYMDS